MWWKVALSGVKKIPREIWYLLGIGIVLWFVHQHGYNKCKAEWDDANRTAESAASRLKQQTTIVLRAVETVHKVETKVIYEKGKTLVQKVPVYIPADSSDLPAGFVRLYDASITGASPEDPRFAATRPIGLATATEGILANNTICLVTRQQYLSLRSAVQKVEETYDQMCKQPGVRCSAGSSEN